MQVFQTSKVRVAILTALSLSISPALFAQQNETSETLEAMTVTGSQVDLGDTYNGAQVARSGRAGLLGNSDIMVTPFSSSNYSEALVRDQQAHSVADVLQNDPTTRVARGYGNFQELYMIRGFPVYSDDLTLNGVYGVLPRQYVAAEILERVEVFRGASTFLNGAAPSGSSVGGSINLVPKRAPTEPLTRVTLGTETGGQGYAAFDVARRLGDNNDTGVRVNAVVRDGETSVNDQQRQLGVLSLGVDHQSKKLRLSADLSYQDHHIDQPRPSVTPGTTAIPSAPDASKNYAQSWTYTDEKQLFGSVRGEYDLTNATSVWLAMGARNGKERNVLANPSADADGNFKTYLFDNIREDNVISADTGIRSELEIFDIEHTVFFSGSAYRLESKNAWAMSSYNALSSNLHNPVDSPMPTTMAYTGGDFSDPLVTSTVNTSSIALADTISLMDNQLLLTVGARYQNIKTESFDYNSGASNAKYSQSRVTPFTGIVYQPIEEVSLYANYAEALVPGDTAPASSGGITLSNGGEVFKPYQAKQIELGVKYDNDQYGASLTAFRTALPSAMVEGNVYTQNGEQRNQGLELGLFGMATDNLSVLGGITWMDAELTKTASGNYDGNQAIGSAKWQANLNLEWQTPFIEGLVLEERTTYTGSQYANQANTLEIPAWTRFDIGARYAFKLGDNDLTLRARIENVADKSYWASTGGHPGYNYLVQSAPRTVMISASYDF